MCTIILYYKHEDLYFCFVFVLYVFVCQKKYQRTKSLSDIKIVASTATSTSHTTTSNKILENVFTGVSVRTLVSVFILFYLYLILLLLFSLGQLKTNNIQYYLYSKINCILKFFIQCIPQLIIYQKFSKIKFCCFCMYYFLLLLIIILIACVCYLLQLIIFILVN